MLKKVINTLLRRGSSGEAGDQRGKKKEIKLSAKLDQNHDELRRIFDKASDILIKEFLVGGRSKWRISIVYLGSLADETMIQTAIIEPLMIWARPDFVGALNRRDLIEQVTDRLVPAQEVKTVDTIDVVVRYILEGDTVLLVDEVEQALVIETKGWPQRQPQEPSVEQTTRGPRLSFTETITDNVALIRRRLKNAGLAVEQMWIGRKSMTDVRIMYMKDMAPPVIVNEVRRRLESIDIDVVLDSGVIQNLIRDHPFSLFSTIRSTERPDSAAADLNEGRVVLVVDNTPFALIMPNSFFMFFTSPEDHYVGFPVAGTLRVLRFLGFFISTFVTPAYVALTTYHHELIPLPLLLNIAATQKGVPFPVALSALFAEIVIEVLREAGLRLPAQFGPAVSIVGALVLGQAAVQAGFISPGLVIVVTMATIASFVVPRTESITSFRLLRFPFLFLGAVMGFYGIAIGAVAVIYHLASMKSLGTPFLGLLTPGRVSELGDEAFLMPSQVSRPVRPAVYRDRTRRGKPPKLKDPKDKGGGSQ